VDCSSSSTSGSVVKPLRLDPPGAAATDTSDCVPVIGTRADVILTEGADQLGDDGLTRGAGRSGDVTALTTSIQEGAAWGGDPALVIGAVIEEDPSSMPIQVLSLGHPVLKQG
jgi:hypothetical protein